MTAEPATRVLKADAIAAAARCLKSGGLVAFPTETVYGLGADAGNGEAVARLYAAKGRPSFNPLIAHVASTQAARRIAAFDADAEKLAAAFWPGPLTLVVPKLPGCPVADLALAGLDSVALRVPAHPVAQALLKAFGGPIVAPSANRSGHVSPTSRSACARRSARPHRHGDRRRAVQRGGRIDHRGLPWPVSWRADIAAAGRRCARADRARRSGMSLAMAAAAATAPLAPGMLASHYAPKAPAAAGRATRRARARPCSPSGPARRRTRPDAQSFAARRSDRGGGQSVFAFARARRFRRGRHRGHDECRTRAWAKRSTTGLSAPRRRAEGAEETP